MEARVNGLLKEINVNARTILPTATMMAGLVAGALFLPVDRQLAKEMLLVFAMAQGWNLLCGYTGLLSFGHHAFVGLGAYALFMTVNTLGASPYLSLGAGAHASSFRRWWVRAPCNRTAAGAVHAAFYSFPPGSFG